MGAQPPGGCPLSNPGSKLEAMAGSRLTARSIEKFLGGEDPPELRWRAEFSRG